ncbi:TonB-dependent receptor plug domain-containing protein [Chryseobacterium polytrichastri]|uniref:TonB-dependent outer membrane receptor, SusC/RagA subfamily, signature region n=1 Tax=Chryseobacterium polytrichastri TaxID=1302687 RepID=A0A1M6UTD9_9FLAO|nr:TonB-dependent receptor plug domain-containing protein [Chryseobacterium polytrichastri]SHK72479.1 TonB-dependent outer membrane receptor, SusC/RagA subfamily, signature region [Chryseobacterium polytrichastri]
MENNHDIDKKFNEASKDLDEPATFPGFDKVWAKVEEKLDTKEHKKRRILPIWLPYGIAASLLIGVGGFYFFNENKNGVELTKPIIAKNIVAINNITVAAPSEKIQKIDQIVKENIEKKMIAPPPIAMIESSASLTVNTYIAPSLISDPVAQSMPAPSSIVPYKADTLKQKNIEEVVVMALGTKKVKKDMTSSVQPISSMDIENKPNNSIVSSLQETAEAESITPYNGADPVVLGYNKANIKRSVTSVPILGEKVGNKYFTNSLQGSVSGLTINMGSGKIDSNNAIVIRGVSSLKEDSNPLYVINGVLSDVIKFKSLDANSIEKMTVVKGEKAIAIYGSKAVNGVIVIETKKELNVEKKK